MPGGKFDAFPKRQSVNESIYNNSLADHHTWSTIKTLPTTLPESSFMDRGPRTGVTKGVSSVSYGLYDMRQHHTSNWLSFNLRPKSNTSALRVAQSVTQRLQDMDVPAIHLVMTNHVDNSPQVMLDAVENYRHIKCNDDRNLVRTGQRKGNYEAKLLGCHYEQLNRLTKRVVAPSYLQDIVTTMSAISTQPVLLKTNG